MAASVSFLCAGILLVQESAVDWITYSVVAIAVIMNVIFFSFWLQILLTRYELKYWILNIFPILLWYLSLYKFSDKERLRIATNTANTTMS